MKKLFVTFLALSTISAYAQVITGGQGSQTKIEFYIVSGMVQYFNTYATISTLTSQDSSIQKTSKLDCENMKLSYDESRSSQKKYVELKFDSKSSCYVVKDCIRTMSAKEFILVKADKANLKNWEITLPKSCTL